MHYVVKLEKLHNKPKKYKAIVTNGTKKKTIQFGASGYEDYTIHKDKDRLHKYIARHESSESWSDPFTAGFWSRWLLWNKPTIKSSMEDIKDKFDIDFE